MMNIFPAAFRPKLLPDCIFIIQLIMPWRRGKSHPNLPAFEGRRRAGRQVLGAGRRAGKCSASGQREASARRHRRSNRSNRFEIRSITRENMAEDWYQSNGLRDDASLHRCLASSAAATLLLMDIAAATADVCCCCCRRFVTANDYDVVAAAVAAPGVSISPTQYPYVVDAVLRVIVHSGVFRISQRGKNFHWPLVLTQGG